jgi:succinyl-CoA synthetase alpha subunit
MSILIDRNTRLLVQGMTGREGSFHTEQMIAYGTQVVAGVTPGKGDTVHLGRPIFDTVRAAVEATGADASVIFVPPAFAGDAIAEAAEAGVSLIVCITEGIPLQDMIRACAYVCERGSRLIGPNCPGIITPGQCKIGILPGYIHSVGPVGLVSRSGTLTYEIVASLTRLGLGQSTVIGIGGDPILGTRFQEVLPLFEADPATRVVVLVGEIGGDDEEAAADYIASMTKPVVGFIAGRNAPPGKRMGHAGAIISGGVGTAQSKVEALQSVGVPVPETPDQIPLLVQSALADA